MKSPSMTPEILLLAWGRLPENHRGYFVKYLTPDQRRELTLQVVTYRAAARGCQTPS